MSITRKGVGKHVWRMLGKMGLGADGDTSPRVAATLLWLAGRAEQADDAAA